MRLLRKEKVEMASSGGLMGTSEPISKQKFLFNFWNGSTGMHRGTCVCESRVLLVPHLFHTSNSRAPSVIFLLSHCASISCISAQVSVLGPLCAGDLTLAGTRS